MDRNGLQITHQSWFKASSFAFRLIAEAQTRSSRIKQEADVHLTHLPNRWQSRCEDTRQMTQVCSQTATT